MGNRVGSEIGDWFKDNVGGLISEIGLGATLALTGGSAAPFIVPAMVAGGAGIVANTVTGQMAKSKQRKANMTAAEAVQAAKDYRANMLQQMRDGSQSGADAGATAKMIAAIQSGAPISQAISASGMTPAMAIAGKAVAAASMKALSGGVSGSANVALHFGDPLQMTARSWATSNKSVRNAREVLRNMNAARAMPQAGGSQPAENSMQASSQNQAGGGSVVAATMTGGVRSTGGNAPLTYSQQT